MANLECLLLLFSLLSLDAVGHESLSIIMNSHNGFSYLRVLLKSWRELKKIQMSAIATEFLEWAFSTCHSQNFQALELNRTVITKKRREIIIAPLLFCIIFIQSLQNSNMYFTLFFFSHLYQLTTFTLTLLNNFNKMIILPSNKLKDYFIL